MRRADVVMISGEVAAAVLILGILTCLLLV
jgi:hypothetical protein